MNFNVNVKKKLIFALASALSVSVLLITGATMTGAHATAGNTSVAKGVALEAIEADEHGIPTVNDDFYFNIPYLKEGMIIPIARIEFEPGVTYNLEFTSEVSNKLFTALSESPNVADQLIPSWDIFIGGVSSDIRFHRELASADTMYVYVGLNVKGISMTDITGRITVVRAESAQTVELPADDVPVVGEELAFHLLNLQGGMAVPIARIEFEPGISYIFDFTPEKSGGDFFVAISETFQQEKTFTPTTDIFCSDFDSIWVRFGIGLIASLNISRDWAGTDVVYVYVGLAPWLGEDVVMSEITGRIVAVR